MKFTTPEFIDEHPIAEGFIKKYGKNMGKMVYECNVRIYWRTVRAREQNMTCLLCSGEMTFERGHKNSVSLEHLIPKSLGGESEPHNYGASCERCNNKRGSESIESFVKKRLTTA